MKTPKQNRDKELEAKEKSVISACMSANGSQGIKPEGFRRPIVNRFRKHVSKPHRPGL